MLYWMILGRRIEEKITLLFKEGRMRGHHHPGIGIEGVHVGTCYGLGKQDYIVPSHRGKLPELMMGIDLKYFLGGTTTAGRGSAAAEFRPGLICTET